MDEWIEIDRIDVALGEIIAETDPKQTNELTERKMTRNQKRKNDMISNVSYMK